MRERNVGGLEGENSEAVKNEGTGSLPFHRATSKQWVCDAFPHHHTD